MSSYDKYITLRDFSDWLERGIDAPYLAMVSDISLPPPPPPIEEKAPFSLGGGVDGYA